MSNSTVLVTGAAGFVGRHVVRKLAQRYRRVKAVVHSDGKDSFADLPSVQVVVADILDRSTLLRAMDGVDVVYHFAALVDSGRTKEELTRVNVDGTRNVWECAASSGVRKALYCSSTAVYGLLAGSHSMITEAVRPRAVEPYGNSKYLGERVALEIGALLGLHTTIIRPVAVFGPGEHTPFGRKLRDAAVSKLLIAGGFQNRRFSFVHVEDVAEAAVFLMEKEIPHGEVFNLAVNEPILFERAFEAYIRVLGDAGSSFARTRFLAILSAIVHKLPSAPSWIAKLLGERFVFGIWHPGFDLIYSSSKLLDTSFRFQWYDFETVFHSCIDQEPSV
ncbi:MAG: NAD-dependent epimerase/dehydratase family protein [Ignavibacteriales bacterium]|nr:NAD-dependent epimerase/dehydratase family protein [Ignavibacteriales bacterium]